MLGNIVRKLLKEITQDKFVHTRPIVTVEMGGENVRNKDQKALTNHDLARLLAQCRQGD